MGTFPEKTTRKGFEVTLFSIGTGKEQDCLQISFLILHEFKRINLTSISPEIIRNRSELVRLSSLNIRSEIWRQSLNQKLIHINKKVVRITFWI